MTDFSRKRRLPHHPQVSAPSPPGWRAVLLGLPAVAVGGFLLAAARGLIEGTKGAPDWVLALCGLLFVGAGLFVAGSGLRGLLDAARRRRRAAEEPDAPWRHHPWDEHVARDCSPGPLGVFGLAAGLTLLFSVFNYFAFSQEDVPLPALGIVLLFDGLTCVVWGYGLYLLGRRLKYGRPRLRLGSFPFLAGQPLRVTLELPPALKDYPELRATLRCAQQEWEVDRASTKNTRSLATHELWSEERRVPPGSVERELTLAFDLPADAPPCELGPLATTTFWELEVDAETPGIDFHALFQLPVYALPQERPACSSATS